MNYVLRSKVIMNRNFWLASVAVISLLTVFIFGVAGNRYGANRYDSYSSSNRNAATFLRKTESRPEQAGIDMSMYPDREEAAFSGLPPTDITPTKAVEKLNAKLMP